MLGLKHKIVKIVAYNSRWQKDFESEAKKLRKILGKKIVAIEHIGSTSIPGMPAKPIIDIAVGLKTQKEAKRAAAVLDKAGYIWRKEVSSPDNQLVVKGPESKRTHYIHLHVYKNKNWQRSIYFRDYLRKDEKTASKFIGIKTKMAKKFKDNRLSYTKGKEKLFLNKFFKKIQPEYGRKK